MRERRRDSAELEGAIVTLNDRNPGVFYFIYFVTLDPRARRICREGKLTKLTQLRAPRG